MKHFKLEEFACPCCNQCNMDSDFLYMVDKARDIAGVPFKITSGYRCMEHNKSVGGVNNSSHVRGFASDIAVTGSRDRYKILMALEKVGFNRFGIGKNFIHVDRDPAKTTDVIWTYYAE